MMVHHKDLEPEPSAAQLPRPAQPTGAAQAHVAP
jgi:hypothetical protein